MKKILKYLIFLMLIIIVIIININFYIINITKSKIKTLEELGFTNIVENPMYD